MGSVEFREHDWPAIRAAFEADRAKRVLEFPAIADPTKAAVICRYCSKRWRHWERSLLDGHVACIASPEVIAVIIEAARTTREHVGWIADQLGIPQNWITAWWQKASRVDANNRRARV